MKREYLVSLIMCLLILLGKETFSQTFNWQKTNLELSGKKFRALIFDDNNNLYIGTNNNSGVYFTSDNGNTWEHLGLDSANISDFVFSNNGYLVAACSEGVFRLESDNQWKKIFDEKSIVSIKINSSGDIFCVKWMGGIYKSSDNGDIWNLISNDETNNLSTMAISPNGDIFLGTLEQGIYKSTDDGENWSKVFETAVTNKLVTAITVDNNGIIFASIIDAGLYRSIDGGATWEEIINLPIEIKNWSEYITRITNSNENKIYAVSRNRVLYSFDQGENWEFSSVILESEITQIAVDNNEKVCVTLGKDGIAYSDNYGTNWTREGVVSSEFNSFAETENNKVFAATVDGLFYTIDDGKNWIEVNEPSFVGNYFNTIIKDSEDNLIVGVNNELHISNDFGETWTNISIPDNYIVNKVIESQNKIFIIIDNGDLYRLKNENSEWERINISSIYYISVIDIEINSDGEMFAATTLGVHSSADNGDTWQKLPAFPNDIISRLEILKNDYIYIDGTFTITDGLSHRLKEMTLLSRNDGVEWEELDTNYVMTCMLNVSDETVLMGTYEKGLYISSDSGATWELENSKFDNAADISSLFIASDGNIFIGANGGSYTSKYELTSVNNFEIPNELSLSQNYPNPFNPNTIIEFSLAESSNMKLEIFNLLGEKVETLLNRFVNAGKHKVEFNANKLPSGLYFYRLSNGKLNVVNKMILLK